MTTLVVAIVLGVTACGGEPKAIRIGVLSVCRGPYAPFYEPTVLGAEVALLRRGGKPAGKKPSEGLEGIRIGGRRTELVFGCSDDSGGRALDEARRLVERENVSLVVGPTTSAAGVAIRDYAKTKPDVAFLVGAVPALEVTLRNAARNLFRFNIDDVQATAGMGTYAYRTLGWRRAVVVGDDFTYNYGEAGGFIAEFCALGGRVVHRTWIDARGPAYHARRIPATGADGYFLTVILPEEALAIVNAAPALRGPLGRKLIAGTTAGLALGKGGLGQRSAGVVAPLLDVDPQLPELARFHAEYVKAFPGTPYLPIAIAYFNGMEAALKGLEATDGATGAKLLKALDQVKIDGPLGRFRLDSRRQAVGPIQLSRIERAPEGGLVQRLFRTVPDVDDSYAGRFVPGKPLPGRTYPACTSGNAPRWARSG